MLDDRLQTGASLAQELLTNALGKRALVMVDRFASAGRNVYTGAAPISALRPHLAVSYFDAWTEAQPRAVLSVESRSMSRKPKAKHQFVTDLRAEIVGRLAALEAPPVVIAWYETKELQALIRPFGAELIAAPAKTRTALEDKSQFDRLLRAAAVPSSVRIKSTRISAGSRLPSLRELAQRFGSPVVIQANSSGGRGTIFVHTDQDLERAAALPGPLRVSEFVPGFSSNTTILTVPRSQGDCDVYVDSPSHKAMHVPEVGIGPAKGAGNDWSLPFERVPSELFVEAAVRIGKYAYRNHGLVGLWGLDSIWNGDAVVINELNCRNQGTTEVSSVNQLLRSLPPFIAAHVAIHQGVDVSWLPPAEDYNDETIARACAPVKRAPFYLKVRVRDSRPVRARLGFPGNGIYQLTEDDQLVWTRPGSHTIEADFDRSEVLLANVPPGGAICFPGVELGTLEGTTTNRAIFAEPNSLSHDGMRLARAAYRLFSDA